MAYVKKYLVRNFLIYVEYLFWSIHVWIWQTKFKKQQRPSVSREDNTDVPAFREWQREVCLFNFAWWRERLCLTTSLKGFVYTRLIWRHRVSPVREIERKSGSTYHELSVVKTVWMQRSTQRVNITDWFLFSLLFPAGGGYSLQWPKRGVRPKGVPFFSGLRYCWFSVSRHLK